MDENAEAIKKGFENVKTHILNLTQKFKVNTVVAINRFPYDNEKELSLLKRLCTSYGVKPLRPLLCRGRQGSGKACSSNLNLRPKRKSYAEYAYDLDDG